MDIRLDEKLRAEYHLDNKIIDGIPVFLNDKYVYPSGEIHIVSQI